MIMTAQWIAPNMTIPTILLYIVEYHLSFSWIQSQESVRILNIPTIADFDHLSNNASHNYSFNVAFPSQDFVK